MSHEAICQHLHQIASGYGKIGLLIDDAPEASSRAARSIYGSESLPRWWLVGRSLPCAQSLLSGLLEALQKRRNLPSVLIVDRYLLVSCEQESGRRVAWDVPGGGLGPRYLKLCGKIKDLISLLDQGRQVSSYPSFFLEFETSYPHGFTGQRQGSVATTCPRLPWKTRSTDLLFRLRKRILEKRRHTLLEFGPSEQTSLDVEDSELRWRAKVWRSTLEDLSKALAHQNPKQPVILLTGAGISLRAGRLSRGMPATDLLLQDACQRVLENDHDNWPDRKDPPTLPAQPTCLCTTIARIEEPPGPHIRDAWKPGTSLTPLHWLLEQVYAGRQMNELEWYLEQLFSPEKNEKKDLQKRWFKEFYDAFRAELHRHDHGFPYHHWLLAQLPWTRVITTNFDGFHERAAATAAASRGLSKDKRDYTLSLGSRLPEVAHGTGLSSPQLKQLRRGRRLFKPYGSLLFPAELDLGRDQLERCRERLKVEFKSLLKKSGSDAWLVVVGHSMRDTYINQVLGFLEQRGEGGFCAKNRLLWVVPDALERSRRVVLGGDTDPRLWDEWMYRMWNQGEGRSGPFPAQASEFAYDLWQTFHGRNS